MDRYLKSYLINDLYKKIILITGPRQVGKTTLTRSLLKDYDYFNYDLIRDRKLIHHNQINFETRPILLDELHKMKNWKRWLKGNNDTRTVKNPIIVTGSAKIDTYKKMGDSLAGRFFQFRLLPLDVKELVSINSANPEQALTQLLELSGFPEPYLSESPREYKRWQASHLDVIIKQDMAEMEMLRNIRSVELLVELMTERVGQLISFNGLREDLNTDDKTIRRWFNALENAYVLFKVAPYSKKINRGISKAPKYYFFDVPRAINPGSRFENLVALSLYKETLFKKDVLGEEYSLHFLRDTNKKEVDFLICHNNNPKLMIECKLSDREHVHSMDVFEKSIGPIKKIILVRNLNKSYTLKDGVRVEKASDWLAKIPI